MACLETFASLRVFSGSVHPDEISATLAIEPTLSRPIDPSSKYRHRREHHYWDWESRSAEQSIDNLAHVNAVLDSLQGKDAALDRLRELGCEIDICCYWISSGQGGPSLDLPTLDKLTRLKLPIWWDIYFGNVEDYENSASKSSGGA